MQLWILTLLMHFPGMNGAVLRDPACRVWAECPRKFTLYRQKLWCHHSPVNHCPIWIQWENRVRRSLEQRISLRTQWNVLILLLGSGASWLAPGCLPWQTLHLWEIPSFYLRLLSSCMQLWEACVQILTAPLWGSDGNFILNLSSLISQSRDMNSPFLQGSRCSI